jgi:hypothetical protein
MLRAATNKAAGVRGIGGGEMAGGYGGGMSPYGEAGGAADSGAFGGGGSNGGGGFSGEVLGQLLGRGDMGAVANYLAQFKGNAGGYNAPKRRKA